MIKTVGIDLICINRKLALWILLKQVYFKEWNNFCLYKELKKKLECTS